jgi:NhaP-type Na+/H+ or K+/H+ antiporter
VHFAVAAIVVTSVVAARKSPRHHPRALGLAAALSLGLILVIIRWYEHVPAWLYQLLKPPQWTYRLMVPAALAGALCLALAFDLAMGKTTRRWARVAVVVAALAYVVVLSTAYFNGQSKWYGTTPAEVVSESFASPNTSGYALRGYWASYYRLRRLTLYDFAEQRTIR